MKIIKGFICLLLIWLLFADISDAQQDVTFTISDECANLGNSVALSVSVSDFVDVTSFQATIQWDTTVVSYNSTIDENVLNCPISFGETYTDKCRKRLKVRRYADESQKKRDCQH